MGDEASLRSVVKEVRFYSREAIVHLTFKNFMVNAAASLFSSKLDKIILQCS